MESTFVKTRTDARKVERFSEKKPLKRASSSIIIIFGIVGRGVSEGLICCVIFDTGILGGENFTVSYKITVFVVEFFYRKCKVISRVAVVVDIDISLKYLFEFIDK